MRKCTHTFVKCLQCSNKVLLLNIPECSKRCNAFFYRTIHFITFKYKTYKYIYLSCVALYLFYISVTYLQYSLSITYLSGVDYFTVPFDLSLHLALGIYFQENISLSQLSKLSDRIGFLKKFRLSTPLARLFSNTTIVIASYSVTVFVAPM